MPAQMREFYLKNTPSHLCVNLMCIIDIFRQLIARFLMTLQTPCYFIYLPLSSEIPTPPLLRLHPAIPISTAPPPMYWSPLLSWFLKLLQVLNSHLKIWSQEPQMRGLFSLQRLPRQTLGNGVCLLSFRGAEPETKLPITCGDNTVMYAQRCRAEM